MFRKRDAYRTSTFVAMALFSAICTSTIAAPQEVKPAAPQADLPDAHKLMERYIDAVGGENAIRAVKSRMMEGSMNLPAMEMSGTLKITAAEPSNFLMEMDLAGMGMMKQGYNGEIGWVVSDMQGTMLIEGEMLEQMKIESDFYGDVNYRKLFPTFETVDETTFAERDAYKVRRVTAAEDESFVFFDKETGLMIGTEAVQSSEQGDIEITTAMKEYKEFDGVKMPTVIEMNQMGMVFVMTFDKVTQNDVDPSVFKVPESITQLLKDKNETDG